MADRTISQSSRQSEESPMQETRTTVSTPHQSYPADIVSSQSHASGQRDQSHVSNEKEPHSVFVGPQRWIVVALATLGGFVSPISAGIYLSALPEVAHDLGRTEEAIALTVTVYMIFQGITPMFFGSMSDTLGRRPIFMVCFVVWMGANIGIANLPNSYVGLMLLRCLQALGSSSAISIAAGIVGDITTTAERGSVMGIVQGGNLIGPALGPLIGGALAQRFGWCAIFWFLFCLGGVTLTLTAFFFPETLRKLVGNGSLPAPTLMHETLWALSRRKTVTQRTGQTRPGLAPNTEKDALPRLQRMRYSFLGLFAPLHLLGQHEIVLCLILNAIPYTAFFMLTTTLATLYTSRYGLSTLEVGLVFLAPGIGSTIAAFTNGRILDAHYQRQKRIVLARNAKELEAGANAQSLESAGAQKEKDQAAAQVSLDLAHFPLERARLRSYPAHLAILVASTILYGWVIEQNVHLAAPTVFTFFAGYASGALISTFSTMIVDYAPGKGASVTSLNNLFRCLLGAGGTAVAQPIVNALNPGWAFTLIGLFVCIPTPLALVLLRYGPGWRVNRQI